MRQAIAFAAAAALMFSAMSAEAAACRDAKGKFTKCPPAATASAAPAKGARCRDASGAFAKCGTAGARPAGANAKAKTAPAVKG